MSILQEILLTKQAEIASAKQTLSLTEIKSRARDAPRFRPFTQSLRTNRIAVIAEIKKASPSRGVLNEHFDHVRLARDYEQGGAHALSILTDRQYFQGRAEFIRDIKAVVRLPVLRKDFIIDEYQVYESILMGADAILLIVKAVSAQTLRDLYECATSSGLAVLVEAHSHEEIDLANAIEAEIIGINNRDLTTFDVSLDRSIELRPLVRAGALTVSESGIQSPSDVERLRKAGFHAVLIGEGLISQQDRVRRLQELLVY